MSAVTNSAWRPAKRKQRALDRLRTWLNHLNRKHPLAYITVLVFSCDAVLLLALLIAMPFK